MKKLCLVISVLAVALLTLGCSLGGDAPTTVPAGGDTTTSTASISTVSSVDELTTTTETTDTTVSLGSTTTAIGDTTTSTAATETTTGVTAVPGKTYTATLTGAEVVPAVTTSAGGTATFTVDSTGTSMSFKLEVSNITDALASRAHIGKPGANGSGLVILYPGPTKTGPFTGTLSAGYFGGSVLIGPLAGKTIADFVDLITSGQAYVNVGTVTHPAGEVRGQILEAAEE